MHHQHSIIIKIIVISSIQSYNTEYTELLIHSYNRYHNHYKGLISHIFTNRRVPK